MHTTPLFDWTTFLTYVVIIVGLILLVAGAFVAYCCCAMSGMASRWEEGYDE